MFATALDVSDRTNIHLSALDGISDQRRNDSEDEHDWCPVETNKMSVKTQNQKKALAMYLSAVTGVAFGQKDQKKT